MSAPPKDLLARCRAGEAEAGIALCRALHPAVRALAFAGTLDRNQAAEATQAALSRIFDRLPETESVSSLLPLAEEVVKEEVTRIVRKQGGRSTELVGIPADHAAKARGATLDLEEIFGDLAPETAALMLLEACGWLPDAYEAVFLLRYLGGLGYEEIAGLSGTTPEEVGKNLAAGRKLYERELIFHLKKLAGS